MMKFSVGRRKAVLVGFLSLLLLGALRVAEPAAFALARDEVFDLFQRLSPRPYEAAPVRVLDIDEASIGRIGQWPWSRQVMADLTDRLRDMGAAAIAFDVLFAEADRASPRRLAPELAALGVEPAVLARLPDHDGAFAASVAAGGVVTGFALTAERNAARPLPKAGIATLGADPARGLHRFPGATVNLPALERAAAGNGNFSLPAADARTVRALPLLALHGDAVVPSLALEALRVAQGAGTIAVRATEGGTASLRAAAPLTVRVGALDIPLAADGSYSLHFTAAAPARSIPAWQVLDPASGLDPAAIRGHIVVVGSSAVGLVDLRPTPLNPFEPGAAIHAGAIEQIVLGHHLARPLAAPVAELAAALAAGVAILLLAGCAPLVLAVGGTATTLAGAGLGAFHLFQAHRLLVDPVPVLASVSLAFLVTAVLRIAATEREKSRLRHAFGHYLAPGMVAALAAHPERLKLGGETREMTFLFTDLEGFTRFTEENAPAVLVRVLNLYLAAMCGIVTRHGGTVDKIVGDAVHAMFNAPLDQGDHADRAVACALEIQAFATRFAADRAAEGLRIGATRIGVNTGLAVVGNFGGAGRFDYTAHGDAINTAARLEAANKSLGTRVCVSGTTVARCAGHRFRPIGTLMLKGKSEGVEAFEPLGAAGEAAADAPGYLEAFRHLVARSLGSDPDGAMLAYARAHPEDALGRLHAARIAQGLGGAAIVVA